MARTLADPVIVVPGITATYLTDEYPLPPDVIWNVMSEDFGRTTLHPDDLRYELDQPARVRPTQVFEIAYKELIAELRYNLAVRADQPVPVFPFGYDWRKPLHVIESELAAFIDEVIERTALLPHYAAAGFADAPKVNLVGHSMGGLVIAGCLETLGGNARVGRVATLATPFRGSLEAVIKVATGTADLGTRAPSSREREMARLTPALYHLIPSFASALEVDPALGVFPDGLFDPDLWQPGVVQTLSEFLRRRAVDPASVRSKAKAEARALSLFRSMLDMARAHRSRIEHLDLATIGLEHCDWLCVVGAGAVTRVRLRIRRKGREPEFVLSSSDRMNTWRHDNIAEDERRTTGDGTVPLEGAIPGFLGEENLICVTRNDFGYWELGDSVLTEIAGFHGILPNMNMLHRLIVRHFTDGSSRHENTWGRPLPGITEADWAPPFRDLRCKRD